MKSCRPVPGANRKKTASAQGFTLVEMLMVCFLISIMLVVSVPALRDVLLTDNLKSAARTIIGTVRGVREEAVREHCPYVVYFDMEKNRIWYEKDKGADTELQDEQRKKREHVVPTSSSVRTLDVWTKTAGRQSGGIAGLWISRQGYMDRTVVHITDEDTTMSLFFSPFLGTIKVVEGYADLE